MPAIWVRSKRDNIYAPHTEKVITVINKTDLLPDLLSMRNQYPDAMLISAREKNGIEALKGRLFASTASSAAQPGDTIITNTRHLAALRKIAEAISDIKAGMKDDIPGDLIALDIRQALHYIGELTGQVLHDKDILGAIFGKFCIGK